MKQVPPDAGGRRHRGTHRGAARRRCHPPGAGQGLATLGIAHRRCGSDGSTRSTADRQPSYAGLCRSPSCVA